MNHARRYTGPLKHAIVTLPGRHVPFDRHVPVDFTADELDHLDPVEWAPLEAVEPAQTPPDADLVAGSIADVRARVDADPALAAAALHAETQGRSRKTLLAHLTAMADQAAPTKES